MGIAERGEALYRQYMDAEDLAKVEAMDAPDRAYFWARLYYEIPRRMNRLLLEDMERAVLQGKARQRIAIGVRHAVAKTLDELWEPTKPHAWFKATMR